MMNLGKNTNSTGISVRQETGIRVIIRRIPPELLDQIFIDVFQLLPIWVMLLISYVSKYSFNIRDYIGNLLVYVTVSCAVVLSDLVKKSKFKANGILQKIAIFLDILILSLSSILYGILLLCTKKVLNVEKDELLICTTVFTLFTFFLGCWRSMKKNVKKGNSNV